MQTKGFKAPTTLKREVDMPLSLHPAEASLLGQMTEMQATQYRDMLKEIALLEQTAIGSCLSRRRVQQEAAHQVMEIHHRFNEQRYALFRRWRDIIGSIKP